MTSLGLYRMRPLVRGRRRAAGRRRALANDAVTLRVLNTTLAEAEVWPALVALLKRHDVTMIGDLVAYPRGKVLALPGIGDKKMAELDQLLARYGLSWKDE